MWQQSRQRSDGPEVFGFETYRMVDVSKRNLVKGSYYCGHYYLSEQMVALAKEVIEKEQPIRFDVLCRRLSPLFNLEDQKITKELKNKTEQLISRISPKVSKLNGFVYLSNLKEITVRYRTTDAFHERKTEDICHEEMMQALCNIGVKYQKLTKDSLIRLAVKALGYFRCGADLRSKLTESLKQMIKRGDVSDCPPWLFFYHNVKYRMGDFDGKKVQRSAICDLASNTHKNEAKSTIIQCYYTVGDVKDADSEGFLPIIIKKTTLKKLAEKQKSFVFKVKNGDEMFGFSKGARTICKKVKQNPENFFIKDDTLIGCVLHVKNGSLWGIKPQNRIKVCDCGKIIIKKSVPDSPESSGFVKLRDLNLSLPDHTESGNSSQKENDKLRNKQAAEVAGTSRASVKELKPVLHRTNNTVALIKSRGFYHSFDDIEVY